MKPYYQDESVTIYCGDCREILPKLYADGLRWGVIVTDPPYGIEHSSNGGGHGAARWGGTTIPGDTDTVLRDWLLSHYVSPAIVFGSWKRSRPPETRAVLTWDKGPATGMGDLSLPWKPNTEEIYVIGSMFKGPRTTSVLSHWSVGQVSFGRLHPNEKPVSLMRDLVAKCPDGTVLDPFSGSGPTLRAAKDLGRQAVGIEIDERYCEIAARRCSQEMLPFVEVR